MANGQGSVTISGSDGSSLVALTGNDYVSSHLSMFQSMTSQLAAAGFNSFNATSNLLLIQNNVGSVGVIGGASSGTGTIVVGDSTNLAYIGGSGNVQIIGGSGNDQILAGSGNDTIAAGTGSDQIFLGSGNSIVYAQGADLIQSGSGQDTIGITGNGATVNGGFGSGAALTVNAGSGTSSTINVVSATAINAAPGATISVTGYGNTSIVAGSGSQISLDQQNGVMRFVGQGATANIVEGGSAGNDTLYGASGATIIVSGSQHNNVFVANQQAQGDGGSVVFDGSAASGGNQFWAGSGNATLIGGTGGDTMVAGTGASTMQGGIGSAANEFDMFFGTSGSGSTMTIENFGSVAGNKVTLFGFGVTAASTAIAGATTVDGSTTLHLANNATIVFTALDKSQLSTQNVISTPSLV